MNQTTTKLHKPHAQKEIIQGVLQNNDGILRLLYTEIFPKFKIYVLRNSGNEAQAKDIFQEAFVAFWRNIKENKFKAHENSSVKGYLLTIAKNKWIDYLRSSANRKTIVADKVIQLHSETDEEEENASVSEQQEKQMTAMQNALQKLGDNCRTVLNLFYFERKSMDEISKKLNIGAASARNQKYRCMEKLRSLTLELKNDG